MDIKLSTNDAEIISTGSVIIPQGKYVEFQIANLKFRIEFIIERNEDNSLKDSRIITDVVDNGSNSRLDIKFINHVGLFMATLPSVLNVATIENRSLYLSFAINSINNTDTTIEDKLFYYTWFLNNI